MPSAIDGWRPEPSCAPPWPPWRPLPGALAFPASTVTLRVAALGAPPPRMRWWALSFFALLALAAAWAGQSVVHNTHILVEVAGRVSSRR